MKITDVRLCMVNDSKVLKSVGLYVEKCEFDKARFESEIGQYIQEVSFGKSSIRDSVRNVSYFI